MRRPVSLPATISSDLMGWESKAELVELGLGGARLIVREPIPPGTTLRLCVEAANLWDPLTLSARVAWSRQHPDEGRAWLGLRFEMDSGQALCALIELLGREQYE